MSNIRVDVDYTIKDGTELKFRAPVDCSQITGLIVYYPGADGNTVSKVFALSDAHGNNVGDIDHLFAEDVVVKVILDVTKGMAFVQNADTNAYLESQLALTREYARKAAPVNLLDNSDFRNPVNQRGFVSGTTISAYTYFLDRWQNYNAENTIILTSEGAKGNGLVRQSLNNLNHLIGKKVTGACKYADGSIRVANGTVKKASDWSSVFNSGGMQLIDGAGSNWDFYARLENSPMQWVALYEGEYTAETLPEYRPKGYAAEFMECQRYAIEFGFINPHLCDGGLYSHDVHFPVRMRLDAPTVTVKSALGAVGYISCWDGSKWVDYGANIDQIHARGCTVKCFGVLPNSALGYTLSANADL